MTRLYRPNRPRLADWTPRADLREPEWSVNDDAKAAAKDARDASRRGEVRVGDRWIPEENLPDREGC